MRIPERMTSIFTTLTTLASLTFSHSPFANSHSPFTSTFARISNFENLTGKGVKAEVNGTTWIVGNRRLMEEHGILIEADDRAHEQRWQNAAHTVIWLADAERQGQSTTVLMPGTRIGPGQGPAHLHACFRALALAP